jgi:hypothetical protein
MRGGASGEPSREAEQVNTTSAPIVPSVELSPATVEEAFTDLLKPPTVAGIIGSMILPWSKQRDGKSLVKSVKAIEATISRLDPLWDNQTRGAFYDPREDYINMPPKTRFLDYYSETATEAYYGTLLHELGHCTGHRSRLNRGSILDFLFSSAYASEELVAEATAMTLLRHFGIAPEDSSRHAHYFQRYLSRAGDTAEALAYARTEAERAAQYILSINTINRPDPRSVV